MMRSQKNGGIDETAHYVSARRQREEEKKHGSTAMRPPLTPMIDVVFLLLLFFLLACQFRVDEGQIAANLPDVGRGPDPPDPIHITLLPGRRDSRGVLIQVDNTDVLLTSAAELYAYLVQMKRHHGEDADKVPVSIKPLGNVRWDHVVDAFNQAVRAGYKKVGFKPSEK